jgi:hypothetical protein
MGESQLQAPTWPIELLNTVVANPVWSVAILLAPALFFGWRGVRLRIHPALTWGLAVASAAAIAQYAYVAVIYCQVPQFTDHLEPQVAAVSCLLMRGEPIYPPPGAAEQYSMPYGPYLYAWPLGYYWLMGPSIFAAKLGGVVSGLGGVGLLLAALKRSSSWLVALPCAALATVLYYQFGADSFWCRADSHEVFLVSLSLLALTLANPWIAAILVGISAGVSLDLKINAGAFFLPIAVALVLRYRNRGATALALMMAIAAAGTPFLFPEISLVHYRDWLREAWHHPLAGEQLRESLYVAGWMVGILLVLGFPSIWAERSGDARAKREWCWIAAGVGAAIVWTLPVAVTVGSGGHDLLPVAPVVVWLVARAWSIGNSGAMRDWLVLPILIVGILLAGVGGYRIAGDFRKYEASNQRLVDDVGQILGLLHDQTIEMGVAGDGTYAFTYARPMLVFAGNPYHLDPASAMDSAEDQGSLPAATTDLCRSGLADFVLIPKSEAPFSLHNWFPDYGLVFSPAFARAFGENYKVRFGTAFFDVYSRNSVAVPAGVVPTGR